MERLSSIKYTYRRLTPEGPVAADHATATAPTPPSNVTPAAAAGGSTCGRPVIRGVPAEHGAQLLQLGGYSQVHRVQLFCASHFA